MLNVIANTIGLPPGMPGLPGPTAAMQASAAGAGGGEDGQWPGYPLRPVVADGAQHPPPSSLDKTFGSFGREAVGLITRCAYIHGLPRCVRASRRVFPGLPGLVADRLFTVIVLAANALVLVYRLCYCHVLSRWLHLAFRFCSPSLGCWTWTHLLEQPRRRASFTCP
jgi:hypothetical protein